MRANFQVLAGVEPRDTARPPITRRFCLEGKGWLMVISHDTCTSCTRSHHRANQVQLQQESPRNKQVQLQEGPTQLY